MRPFIVGLAFFTLQALCAVSAHADQKADKLLAEVDATCKAAKTMTVTLKASIHTPDGIERLELVLTLQKPDKFRVVQISASGPGDYMNHTDVSDGTTQWEFDQVANQYTKKMSFHISGFYEGLTPGMLFFTPGALLRDPDDLSDLQVTSPSNQHITVHVHMRPNYHVTVTKQYLGDRKLGKIVCRVVAITRISSLGSNVEELYIGPDKLVHRAIVRSKTKGLWKEEADTIVTDSKVDAPVTDADFTFVPPAGAKQVARLK